MKIKQLIMIGFMLLVLTACSSRTQHMTMYAALTPEVSVRLPKPTIVPRINYHQLLTAKVNEQEHHLEVLLTADDKHLSLIGLSSLGLRVFSVNYDQQGIDVQHSLKLPELPPANQVLADIMLSYWPIASWRLPKDWLLIDITPELRQLSDDKSQVIAEIYYDDINGERHPVLINQYAFNYQIMIKNLDK